MDVYDNRYNSEAPNTEKKWVLVCDEDEVLALCHALHAALSQPPHREHDCDEDEFACAVFSMRNDLRDADETLFVWDEASGEWSVRNT